MNEIRRLKEAILRDSPRYGPDDTFRFACYKGLSCFNTCCADVNIFLTPLDVVRMKNRLGVSSDEFIDRYTLIPFDRNQKYPTPLLKMTDTEEKRCPFVSETEGCTIYADRPWACRMYPLGLASPGGEAAEGNEPFYFLMEERPCDGFSQDRRWTVREWIRDQGVEPYNELGERFKEIILHPRMREGALDPRKIEMFFMVCYNIDAFRRFVFESRFLEMFEVGEEVLKKIREDDIELMRFGFEWLKFSLFGEKTMRVKPEVLERKRKELGVERSEGVS